MTPSRAPTSRRPPSTRRVVKQRRAASLGDGVEAVAARLEGDGLGERADGGARGRGPGERAEDVAGGDGVDDDVAVAADGEAQAVLALIGCGDEAEVDLSRVLEGDAAARSERAARDEDLGGGRLLREEPDVARRGVDEDGLAVVGAVGVAPTPDRSAAWPASAST